MNVKSVQASRSVANFDVLCLSQSVEPDFHLLFESLAMETKKMKQ